MEKKDAENAASMLRSIIKDNCNDTYGGLWKKLERYEYNKEKPLYGNTCLFVNNNCSDIEKQIKSIAKNVRTKAIATVNLINLYFLYKNAYIIYDDWMQVINLKRAKEHDHEIVKNTSEFEFPNFYEEGDNFDMDEYIAMLDDRLIGEVIPRQMCFSNFTNSYMLFATAPGERSSIFAVEFLDTFLRYTLVDITGEGWINILNIIEKPYDVAMSFYYRRNYYLPVGKCTQTIYPHVKGNDDYVISFEDSFDDFDNEYVNNENLGYYCLTGIYSIHKMIWELMNRDVHICESVRTIEKMSPQEIIDLKNMKINIRDFDYTAYHYEDNYEYKGGHHSSPCMHERREHDRHYKDGKTVKVRGCTVAAYNDKTHYKTRSVK